MNAQSGRRCRIENRAAAPPALGSSWSFVVICLRSKQSRSAKWYGDCRTKHAASPASCVTLVDRPQTHATGATHALAHFTSDRAPAAGPEREATRTGVAAAQARGDDGLHDVTDRKDEANEHLLAVIGGAEVERDLAELREIALARERIRRRQLWPMSRPRGRHRRAPSARPTDGLCVGAALASGLAGAWVAWAWWL